LSPVVTTSTPICCSTGGAGSDNRKLALTFDQAAFIPAIIAPDEVGAGQPAPTPRQQRTSVEDGSARRLSGLLEIVLTGGSRVIVDRDVSAAALARVIGVLKRR